MRGLFLLLALAGCSTPPVERLGSTTAQLTLDAGEPLEWPDGSVSGLIRFPSCGSQATHENIVRSGQPADLNLIKTCDYPTGNSSAQYGDTYHYYSTLVGQVVSISTASGAGCGPSGSYFLIRESDDLAAAQVSAWEVSNNLASDYAFELLPVWNGTTSMRYGPHVTQGTIDLVNAETTLRVRSGTTVLTETTPAIADTETALLVRRNVGGSYSLQRVTQAATGSCGTGFRCLRVPD